MNTEEIMRVYVVESRYDDQEAGINVTDVPSVPFINCRNPLYIGVRQGQVNRMKKNIHNEKLGGTALGYWEMTPYVSRKGKVNLDEFKKHDVVFLASPERCSEKVRPVYAELINFLAVNL